MVYCRWNTSCNDVEAGDMIYLLLLQFGIMETIEFSMKFFSIEVFNELLNQLSASRNFEPNANTLFLTSNVDLPLVSCS